MMDNDVERLHKAVTDLASNQRDFHGAFYTEVLSIRESSARVEERLVALIGRVDSRMEDHSARMERAAMRATQMAAAIQILESIEARRSERVRIAKLVAQFTAAAIAAAATLFGLAQAAMAIWGGP